MRSTFGLFIIVLSLAVTFAALAQQQPAQSGPPSPNLEPVARPALQQDISKGDSYGLRPGSVGAFANGGMQINNGAHPTIGGGMDVGLIKYFGLYGEGSYTLAYNAQLGEFFGGGGVMVTGNNRSHIVPFGRFGMDYGRLTVFRYGGVNVPAVRYGGGFDAYVTRHFGIETAVTGLRTVGRYSGANLGFVTFGLFYRTK